MLLKRCLIVLFVLFLVWFLLYHVPLPWYVSRDMDGYRWDQAGNATPVSIHIKGWYLMRLQRANTFSGYFSISDGPDLGGTVDLFWHELPPIFPGANQCFSSVYSFREHDFINIGTYWEQRAFRVVVGASDDNLTRVAFPAETPEEAQALFDDVTSSNWGWPEPEE